MGAPNDIVGKNVIVDKSPCVVAGVMEEPTVVRVADLLVNTGSAASNPRNKIPMTASTVQAKASQQGPSRILLN